CGLGKRVAQGSKRCDRHFRARSRGIDNEWHSPDEGCVAEERRGEALVVASQRGVSKSARPMPGGKGSAFLGALVGQEEPRFAPASLCGTLPAFRRNEHKIGLCRTRRGRNESCPRANGWGPRHSSQGSIC